jgi:hypothetical protein
MASSHRLIVLLITVVAGLTTTVVAGPPKAMEKLETLLEGRNPILVDVRHMSAFIARVYGPDEKELDERPDYVIQFRSSVAERTLPELAKAIRECQVQQKEWSSDIHWKISIGAEGRKDSVIIVLFDKWGKQGSVDGESISLSKSLRDWIRARFTHACELVFRDRREPIMDAE